MDHPIQVAVIVNQPKPPSILLLPSARGAMFGCDQSISVVDFESASLRRTCDLEGVFFEFFRNEKQAQILALHELGVVSMSEQGEELWRYLTSDILENWSVGYDCITLTIMGIAIPQVLSLKTGLPVSVGANNINPRANQ